MDNGGCAMNLSPGEMSPQGPGAGAPAPRRLPLSTFMGIAILAAVAVAAAIWIVPTLGPALQPGEHPGTSQAEAHPAVGQRLPALELEPISGASQPIRLADLAGKVVVLNFWGTWCPPCRLEIPELAELYRRLAGEERFRLLAVSCLPRSSEGEEFEELKAETVAFLRSQGLSLPVYGDPSGITRAAFRQLGGRSVFPTTVLLDGQGVVRAVWVGYAPGVVEAIQRRAAELLAEPAP